MQSSSQQVLQHVFMVAMAWSLWHEHRARRYAEARADRLADAGVVDPEPVVAATEDLVAALRRNGARRRADDVAVVRVLP